MKRILISAIVVVALSPCVHAQEESIGDLLREPPVAETTAESQTIEGTSPGSLWSTFSDVIAWTLVMVAGAGALLLLLKKFTPAGRLLNANGAVSVIGRTALSPRHSVFVLRVSGSKILIVGVSGDRMVNLSEISDSNEVLAFDGGFREQLESAERDERGSANELETETDVRPYRGEIDKLRSVIRGWRGLMSRPYTKGGEKA